LLRPLGRRMPRAVRHEHRRVRPVRQQHVGRTNRVRPAGGDKPFAFSAERSGENTPSRLVIGKEREQDLDFFLLYGPGFDHIIDRFTTLTGKPPMFPKPVFGLSYHTRSGKDTQTPGEFTRFRNEGYPIDNCVTFINRSWHEKSDNQVKAVPQEFTTCTGGSSGIWTRPTPMWAC